MKFVKGNLENISGVEIFPMISLLIFFTFFIGLFIYALTRKKEYIDEVSHLPLEMEEESANVQPSSTDTKS